jgi:hypothetical protein
MQTINEQDIGTNADWQKLIGEQYAKLSSTRDGYTYINLIFPVVEYDDILGKCVCGGSCYFKVYDLSCPDRRAWTLASVQKLL